MSNEIRYNQDGKRVEKLAEAYGRVWAMVEGAMHPFTISAGAWNSYSTTLAGPEPEPGSIVRHPNMSIAFIRTWHGSWRSTLPSGKTTLDWEDVVAVCNNDPVVVLSMPAGVDSYRGLS